MKKKETEQENRELGTSTTITILKSVNDRLRMSKRALDRENMHLKGELVNARVMATIFLLAFFLVLIIKGNT